MIIWFHVCTVGLAILHQRCRGIEFVAPYIYVSFYERTCLFSQIDWFYVCTCVQCTVWLAILQRRCCSIHICGLVCIRLFSWTYMSVSTDWLVLYVYVRVMHSLARNTASTLRRWRSWLHTCRCLCFPDHSGAGRIWRESYWCRQSWRGSCVNLCPPSLLLCSLLAAFGVRCYIYIYICIPICIYM